MKVLQQGSLLSLVIFLAVKDTNAGAALTCKSGVTGNQNLTAHSGNYLNIHASMPMECDGLVTAWQLHAKAAGEVYIGLWNYNATTESATLTKKNKITVSSQQVNKSSVFAVSDANQMESKIGLVTGYHYPNETSVAIISKADGGNLCCGLQLSDLGRYFSKAKYDANIREGQVVTGLYHNGVRIAGVAAHVRSEPRITIQPDPNTDVTPLLDDSSDTCLKLAARTEWYFLSLHYKTVSFGSIQFNVTMKSSSCNDVTMYMNDGKSMWLSCNEESSEETTGNTCVFVCSCYDRNIVENCNSFMMYTPTAVPVCDIQPTNYSFM